MRKQTLYGKDARSAVLKGVNSINDAVKVTLGPLGRNVLISQSMVVDYGVHSLPISVTKDGYSVARAFDTDEPFEKAGVLMIKEATQKTVNEAGDGTTTCSVLAQAIAEKGIDMVNNGENPVAIKRALDVAVQDVVAQLKEMSTPIKGDNQRIRQIATISANNDPEIGNMIADAFEKIGDEGIIDLAAGRSVQTEIKIADGYKWPKSWVHPIFINNKEKQICEFHEPLILLYEKRINHHTQIERAVAYSIQVGRPILIICEDAEGEGLAYLAANNYDQIIKCCIVKAPGFNDSRRQDMEDLEVLTGATYISDIKGVNIKEIEPAHFGYARKVTVSKEETIIIGAGGDKQALEDLLNELRMNLAQAKNEEESHPIESRIAKLCGGVAVIVVGAATETEMKEKLDRFDDAVRAVKSAISEGYIVGGGTAFLRVKTENPILKQVLSAPLKQICENSGVDAAQIIKQVSGASGDIGYNAKTDKIEDLIKGGVIDPVKVLRCALTNAASSAGMILTTEALIADTL